MRRLISIAAFALVLTVPVWAQRGGHGGGGGHVGGGGMHAGGFASRAGGGMHAGGFASGRSFSGMRSGGIRSGPGPAFSRGVNHSSNRGFSRVPFRDHGFRHDHDFGRFRFHNNCFGFACNNWAQGWGSPWWGWGWYDPWLWSSWDDDDRRFDEDYYRQYEMADRWNQQSLAEQRMLQQEEADGDQDAYAPRSSNRRSYNQTPSQPPDPEPATVLVFRDRHQQEIQNFAIVGQTLWAFSSGQTEKVSLADLDIPATEKANDDRGIMFRVPSASEGQ